MRDPATVLRLVQALRAEGVRSPYLDRVAARVGEGRVAHAQRELERVEQEIRGEMAAALGRAAERLDVAYLRCEVAGRDLDAAEGEGPRAAAGAAYAARREEAIRARWELLVHREALGLYRHEEIEREYPVPPRR